MTEIHVSSDTSGISPAAAAPPPAVEPPAAPPADPPASEADAKAAAAIAAERKEVREIAEAKAATFRAKKEAEQYKAELAKVQGANEAYLQRIKAIEELEAMGKDPDKFLDWAEKQGLTAQQLVKRAAQGKSPEEFIKEAEAKATAAAKAEFERLHAERQKAEQEQIDKTAALSLERDFIQEFTGNPDKYPTLAAMIEAGPVLKRTAVQETWNILQLAAQHTKETGIRHTDDEVKKELETYLAKEYGSLTERKSALAQKPSAATGSTESAKSAAAAPNVTDSRANDLATLGSDLPKDFGEWPIEKQNKWFIDKVSPKR